jgi:hypothetical protein
LVNVEDAVLGRKVVKAARIGPALALWQIGFEQRDDAVETL